MRAVFDAGPLIHLSRIGQLQILHDVFDRILIPSVVKDEVLRPGDRFQGSADLQTFLESTAIEVRNPDLRFMVDLPDVLHRGEIAAIALMQESRADILALDDGRARTEATRLGIPITGTIGILRRAREQGMISGVTPHLIELRKLGFWISDTVFEQIQQEEASGE